MSSTSQTEPSDDDMAPWPDSLGLTSHLQNLRNLGEWKIQHIMRLFNNKNDDEKSDSPLIFHRSPKDHL